MFTKILVANRGEIACRIIETAHAMGVATVAVHSDVDAQSKHVTMASEAVHIGGNAPADSYLRGDAIVAAALSTGAQAIHPGYGFLSENPDFVRLVESKGLTFIGPSAKAIDAMGLKDAAKVLMEAAGVPVVPGYHGSDQSEPHLEKAAGDIGYPVLIKAVAGGGGKGMRLVERAQDFAASLASARSEALAAFGNSDVLIEKFVTSPRHIEVQVFGDGVSALHLFERDCSLQRRHQKVIEEAPAPGMTADVRAAMGHAAVRAAEAIGYKGAGTVEFIVDGSGPLRTDGFWFMEMNTRLQVEHPVTEAVTGIDLVEWQLRVASGEALPLSQDEIELTGHAFEARLYAEDVPKGFLPATGTLDHLQFPETLRSDSGVRPGDTISPHYDPMIAKLIVHGPTRAVALARLRAGLNGTQVAGTVTNLGFLHALACHDGFARGEVDTGLIARDLDNLAAHPEPGAADWALAAINLLGQCDTPLAGFTLWEPLSQSVHLSVQGAEPQICTVQRSSADTALVCTPLGDVHMLHGPGGWMAEAYPARAVHRSGGRVTLLGAHAQIFELHHPLDRAAAAGSDSDVIDAPMPGTVKAVNVSTGQSIAQGDVLCVLEAMKMEHSLTAPRDGTIDEVLVDAGAQVAAGDALIQLAPHAEEDA